MTIAVGQTTPETGEEVARRIARIYLEIGVPSTNKILTRCAAESPAIAAVRDALREMESEANGEMSTSVQGAASVLQDGVSPAPRGGEF